MANSSDWLGVIERSERAEAQGAASPGWLAMLSEPGEFREALNFGEQEREASPSEHRPDPAAEAFARAYAEGKADGRAAATAEAEATATRQRALRLAFRSLDEAAAQVLSEDLAATVMALCDATLADCAVNRDALLARCHAAAKRIGGAAETLILHLHPDDAAMLGADALGGWQAKPDAALERGTVLIEGADGVVSDGPAEWRRAIAAAVRG